MVPQPPTPMAPELPFEPLVPSEDRNAVPPAVADLFPRENSRP